MTLIKRLLIVLSLGWSAHASAVSLFLINHSNADVWCARGMVIPALNMVEVQHWYHIKNGVGFAFDCNHFGSTAYLYCKEDGGSRQWGPSSGNKGWDLCVSSDSNYVNPINDAANPKTCNAVRGKMVHFIGYADGCDRHEQYLTP